MATKIPESGEMYLETIYILKQNKDYVRSVDIVNELGYTKSSVSRAVNLLKNKGYITIANDGKIDFTKEGLRYASIIYDRHNILTECFRALGVSSEVAEADACRIEHIISHETIEAIKKYMKMMEDKGVIK